MNAAFETINMDTTASRNPTLDPFHTFSNVLVSITIKTDEVM